MTFNITITAIAESHLQDLPAREQRILEAAILAKLQRQPTTVAKAVKRLRANPFAEYELRVGDLRVLDNVEKSDVVLLVIGRKVGNKLIVEGEEFHGHQDNPPLSQLEADPKGTMNECADSGQAFVIELPDHRLISVQPLDGSEDDELVSELLQSNAAFQALVAKSKASPRKPFAASSGS